MPSIDASRLAATVSAQARRAAKIAFNEARAIVGSDGATFMSVEAQEAQCRRIKEVRVVNNVKSLDMTIINNPAGAGVIISKLGCGTASAAGMLVGDVIECKCCLSVKRERHQSCDTARCHISPCCSRACCSRAPRVLRQT
jgi:hypothetical protein